jgi:hypothetical protein
MLHFLAKTGHTPIEAALVRSPWRPIRRDDAAAAYIALISVYIRWLRAQLFL